MRVRGTRSIGPYFAKSTTGQGARSKPDPAAGRGDGGRCRGRSPVAEVLHILRGDPALAAAAADARERDAELTREPADRWACVDRSSTVGGGRCRRDGCDRLGGGWCGCDRLGGGGCGDDRRGCGGCGDERRGCGDLHRGAVALRSQRQQQAPFSDLVAQLDVDLGDRAGSGGGDVHRRLVGLERHQWVVERHGVSDRHQDLDHRHTGEIADVGHGHRQQRRRHRVVGIATAASIP